MKLPLPLAVIGVILIHLPSSLLAALDTPNAAREPSPERLITERGAHHRVWQQDRSIKSDDGRVINQPSRVVELATGLHYFENGQWNESRDEIEITMDGAAATKGAHKVHFAGNINSLGAITLTTPDNQTMRSHVLGLAYTDLANGRSVFIGQIKDSAGLLYAPNQVVYPNAFSGALADIRYAYTKGGFEQDIILREQLRSPADYNLNPETTSLEVWTEFMEAPQPEKKLRRLGGVADEELNFGSIRIGRGSAFALGLPANRITGAVVGKTWINDGNRTFLIESVPYRSIVKELGELPASQASLAPRRGEGVRGESRLALLQTTEVPFVTASLPIEMAMDTKSFDTRKGLVVDYVLVAGDQTDFTFESDKTYFISEGMNFFGTTRFEGGTVLKYNTTNDVQLQTWGATIFETDQFHPAIFTSRNDSTVGEDLYLAGSPTNYFGALSVTEADMVFQHLRIMYSKYAIHTYSLKARHVQFVNCGTALQTELRAAKRLLHIVKQHVVIWPIFYGNHAVLTNNGYTPSSLTAEPDKVDVNWIAKRQTNLWARLAAVRPTFCFLTASGATYSTSNATVTGLAPVEVKAIKLNGTTVNPVWTTDTNWSITTTLTLGSNYLQIVGFDRKTNSLPVRDVGGYTTNIYVNYTP